MIFDGEKEAGLAGLFLAATNKGVYESLTLRNTPISYLFDNREGVDYFSLAIHVPKFLQWGDVSLAAGLTGLPITFARPVTMSGEPIPSNKEMEWQDEFASIRTLLKTKGNVIFEF